MRFGTIEGKVEVMKNAGDSKCGAVEGSQKACAWATTRMHEMLTEAKGQGTTEYAILVGVLVVIAILAIMVFRPRLQELWNAIAEGINGL